MTVAAGSPVFFQLKRIRIPDSAGASPHIIQLDQDVVKFGRNPEQVTITLNSAYYANMISREHAEVRRQPVSDNSGPDRGPFKYFLYDKSLNGTYVNDYRVSASVELQPGDIVNFGHINGAAIQPGEQAPQGGDAEFSYMFERGTPGSGDGAHSLEAQTHHHHQQQQHHMLPSQSVTAGQQSIQFPQGSTASAIASGANLPNGPSNNTRPHINFGGSPPTSDTPQHHPQQQQRFPNQSQQQQYQQQQMLLQQQEQQRLMMQQQQQRHQHSLMQQHSNYSGIPGTNNDIQQRLSSHQQQRAMGPTAVPIQPGTVKSGRGRGRGGGGGGRGKSTKKPANASVSATSPGVNGGFVTAIQQQQQSVIHPTRVPFARSPGDPLQQPAQAAAIHSRGGMMGSYGAGGVLRPPYPHQPQHPSHQTPSSSAAAVAAVAMATGMSQPPQVSATAPNPYQYRQQHQPHLGTASIQPPRHGQPFQSHQDTLKQQSTFANQQQSPSQPVVPGTAISVHQKQSQHQQQPPQQQVHSATAAAQQAQQMRAQAQYNQMVGNYLLSGRYATPEQAAFLHLLRQHQQQPQGTVPGANGKAAGANNQMPTGFGDVTAPSSDTVGILGPSFDQGSRIAAATSPAALALAAAMQQQQSLTPYPGVPFSPNVTTRTASPFTSGLTGSMGGSNATGLRQAQPDASNSHTSTTTTTTSVPAASTGELSKNINQQQHVDQNGGAWAQQQTVYTGGPSASGNFIKPISGAGGFYGPSSVGDNGPLSVEQTALSQGSSHQSVSGNFDYSHTSQQQHQPVHPRSSERSPYAGGVPQDQQHQSTTHQSPSHSMSGTGRNDHLQHIQRSGNAYSQQPPTYQQQASQQVQRGGPVGAMSSPSGFQSPMREDVKPNYQSQHQQQQHSSVMSPDGRQQQQPGYGRLNQQPASVPAGGDGDTGSATGATPSTVQPLSVPPAGTSYSNQAMYPPTPGSNNVQESQQQQQRTPTRPNQSPRVGTSPATAVAQNYGHSPYHQQQSQRQQEYGATVSPKDANSIPATENPRIFEQGHNGYISDDNVKDIPRQEPKDQPQTSTAINNNNTGIASGYPLGMDPSTEMVNVGGGDDMSEHNFDDDKYDQQPPRKKSPVAVDEESPYNNNNNNNNNNNEGANDRCSLGEQQSQRAAGDGVAKPVAPQVDANNEDDEPPPQLSPCYAHASPPAPPPKLVAEIDNTLSGATVAATNIVKAAAAPATKMECDSSVPSPPNRTVNNPAPGGAPETDDTQVLNSELEQLAKQAAYRDSPEDAFDLPSASPRSTTSSSTKDSENKRSGNAGPDGSPGQNAADTRSPVVVTSSVSPMTTIKQTNSPKKRNKFGKNSTGGSSAQTNAVLRAGYAAECEDDRETPSDAIFTRLLDESIRIHKNKKKKNSNARHSSHNNEKDDEESDDDDDGDDSPDGLDAKKASGRGSRELDRLLTDLTESSTWSARQVRLKQSQGRQKARPGDAGHRDKMNSELDRRRDGKTGSADKNGKETTHSSKKNKRNESKGSSKRKKPGHPDQRSRDSGGSKRGRRRLGSGNNSARDNQTAITTTTGDDDEVSDEEKQGRSDSKRKHQRKSEQAPKTEYICLSSPSVSSSSDDNDSVDSIFKRRRQRKPLPNLPATNATTDATSSKPSADDTSHLSTATSKPKRTSGDDDNNGVSTSNKHSSSSLFYDVEESFDNALRPARQRLQAVAAAAQKKTSVDQDDEEPQVRKKEEDDDGVSPGESDVKQSPGNVSDNDHSDDESNKKERRRRHKSDSSSGPDESLARKSKSPGSPRDRDKIKSSKDEDGDDGDDEAGLKFGASLRKKQDSISSDGEEEKVASGADVSRTSKQAKNNDELDLLEQIRRRVVESQDGSDSYNSDDSDFRGNKASKKRKGGKQRRIKTVNKNKNRALKLPEDGSRNERVKNKRSRSESGKRNKFKNVPRKSTARDNSDIGDDDDYSSSDDKQLVDEKKPKVRKTMNSMSSVDPGLLEAGEAALLFDDADKKKSSHSRKQPSDHTKKRRGGSSSTLRRRRKATGFPSGAYSSSSRSSSSEDEENNNGDNDDDNVGEAARKRQSAEKKRSGSVSPSRKKSRKSTATDDDDGPTTADSAGASPNSDQDDASDRPRPLPQASAAAALKTVEAASSSRRPSGKPPTKRRDTTEESADSGDAASRSSSPMVRDKDGKSGKRGRLKSSGAGSRLKVKIQRGKSKATGSHGASTSVGMSSSKMAAGKQRSSISTKPGRGGKRSGRSKRKAEQTDEATDDSAVYETIHNPVEACGAGTRCVKPNEDTVDWVQCDDCEAWFHVNCVGCDLDLVKDEDTDFHCGCINSGVLPSS